MSGNRIRCLEASPPLPGGRTEQWPASRTHKDGRSSTVNAWSTHCVATAQGLHGCIWPGLGHKPCSQPTGSPNRSDVAQHQQQRHLQPQGPAALAPVAAAACAAELGGFPATV